eukprot:Gb_21597 [translate_table: standard]
MQKCLNASPKIRKSPRSSNAPSATLEPRVITPAKVLARLRIRGSSSIGTDPVRLEALIGISSDPESSKTSYFLPSSRLLSIANGCPLRTVPERRELEAFILDVEDMPPRSLAEE